MINNFFRDFYGKFLLGTKIFKNNFSEECLNIVSLNMKERMFGPGEIVYNQGDDDHSVYFIRKGYADM